MCTLGCPKNEADSWRLRRTLARAGVQVVEDPENATHIFINTCGFIRDAKEESIAAILDAAMDYPGKKVVVAGCLVQRYRSELEKEIPEVSAWFGLLDQVSLTELLAALGVGEEGLTQGEEPSATEDIAARHDLRLGRSYAYLKISDGCDEPCTFCAIPLIKGPYKALPAEAILAEADACLAEGARELILVGQNTAIWRDGNLDLADLVRLLARDERTTWIRTMYLQPEQVSLSLVERLVAEPKWCRYFDLPFQHSHPQILEAMGRPGSGAKNLALLQEIKKIAPDAVFRSTFIVGFPGETEEHFEELLAFVTQAQFDYAGGFVYSPEEGTAAAKLRPRVKRTIAIRRLNQLTAVLEESSLRRRLQLVGTRVSVMLDVTSGPDLPEGVWAIGRTMGQAPEIDGVTYLEGAAKRGVQVGDVVDAWVEEVAGYDLVATCSAS
ncbi:MAG: 30S ribosomal protein S12 methylthiotransferase RimO [Thermoleophilia bacterium]|nr:30S ribosomal protein S12 methylthiotransferase RimO [Thermoleophilia bacterium]